MVCSALGPIEAPWPCTRSPQPPAAATSPRHRERRAAGAASWRGQWTPTMTLRRRVDSPTARPGAVPLGDGRGRGTDVAGATPGSGYVVGGHGRYDPSEEANVLSSCHWAIGHLTRRWRWCGRRAASRRHLQRPGSGAMDTPAEGRAAFSADHRRSCERLSGLDGGRCQGGRRSDRRARRGRRGPRPSAPG